MKGDGKAGKGISTDVNWGVFKHSIILYIITIAFGCVFGHYINQWQNYGLQTACFVVLIWIIASSYSLNQLRLVITALEIFTVIVLAAIFSIFPAMLVCGIYSVPLSLLMYACSISVAHLFEYLFVCAYHPEDLDWESFLINQSKEYVFSHAFALSEFFVELYLVPGWLKVHLTVLPALGFAMIIVGHFFRIGAMFTAAQSFHHKVQWQKAREHKLITSGVYQMVRHPSYFGWTLWAVGT